MARGSGFGLVCWLAAASLLSSCGGSPAARPSTSVGPTRTPLSTLEVSRLALPHVVNVRTLETSGSGFFIGPDLVVTCFHVVQGRDTITVSSPAYAGGVVTVLGWSVDADLAVLRVAPRRSQNGLVLSNQFENGAPVVVVSTPLGLDNTVSDGVLSGFREGPPARLQFTAPISPGSSGGAVLDNHGQVIGVVAQTLTVVEGGRTYGQNLNFAVPAIEVARLLDKSSEMPIGVFALQTQSSEERRIEEFEAKLTSIEAELTERLGQRVGTALVDAIKSALSERNIGAAERLLENGKQRYDDRERVVDLSARLATTGQTGTELAGELIALWEAFVLDGSEESRTRLVALLARANAFLDEQARILAVPQFPPSFAGLPFRGAAQNIYRFCFPGYTIDARPGIAILECPSVPISPPFVRGSATLTFLDGALVAVTMVVSDFAKAVEAVEVKYGTPRIAVFGKDGWTAPGPAGTRPYGKNTAYDWALRGGRIRVGRLTGPPFVAFVHEDRDLAVESSY